MNRESISIPIETKSSEFSLRLRQSVTTDDGQHEQEKVLTKKDIIQQFGKSKFTRWPPTLDVTKFTLYFDIRTWWHDKKNIIPTVNILIGPILFGIVLGSTWDDDSRDRAFVAASTVWMALWWLTEAVPLPITALLPLIIFPFAGVMNHEAVASYYVSNVNFLMIGGFFLSLAMERWGLHKRIALKIVLLAGGKPFAVLLGMLTTVFIVSMFMSNTAAVMMMLPNALAVSSQLQHILNEEEAKRFATGMCLSLAFGASLGGCATLVGSPPNLVFVEILKVSFPDAPPVSFATWLFFGIPVSVILLAILYIIVYYRYCPKSGITADTAPFKTQYEHLGPMEFEEIVVVTSLLVLVLLWLFRADIDFGTFVIPGWSRLFPETEFIGDGTVAILVTFVLFTIPAREREVIEKHGVEANHSTAHHETQEDGHESHEMKPLSPKSRNLQSTDHQPSEHHVVIKKGWTSRILGWKMASKIPWDVVLLLGGGFALAAAFSSSGLSQSIGSSMSSLKNISPFGLVIISSLLVHLISEFTSNTACTQILLPIMASLAVSIEVDPRLLMLPTVFSASLSFAMPVATPPNLIVFATHAIPIREMLAVGLIMDLLAIIVVSGAVFSIGLPIFDMQTSGLPSWANQ